jgi:hypothetical protein
MSLAWLRTATLSLITTSMLATSVGCMKSIDIAPPEIPKLSHAFETAGNVDGRNVVVESVQRVEASDGRLVEIKGKFSLVVQTNDGRKITFEQPIEAKSDAGAIVVRSGNLTAQQIQLSDISKASVVQVDTGKAVILYAVLLGVTAGLTLLIVAGGAHSGP